MPRNEDVGDLLNEWPYDPNDYTREIVGKDGRPKLQVRFPMGIEQYELDGRPDGLRPMGCESYLHHFLRLREEARTRGEEESFRLSPDDCQMLRDEAIIYYYRYDLLYQRKQHERVVRDSARNLMAFDLMARCAEAPEDSEAMEIYRPFTVCLLFASRALLSVRRRRHDEAMRQVRLGIHHLEQLDPIEDPKWKRERKSAAARLRRLERRIRRARPLTPRQRLQQQLKQAVDLEDYEFAAKLRDRIASLPEEGETNESAR